jgi:hypothetical protein
VLGFGALGRLALGQGSDGGIDARAGVAAGVGATAAIGSSTGASTGSAAGIGAAIASGARLNWGIGAATGIGAASALSFYFDKTSSVLKPDADNIDGNWKTELGGTVLAPSIDDTSPDDSDYIISSDRPVSDICKLSLSNPAIGIQSPVAVLYRFKKQGPDPVSLRVRLLEGTNEIAAWTHSDIAVDFLTVEQVLTPPQVAAIIDPANLFFEFRASNP